MKKTILLTLVIIGFIFVGFNAYSGSSYSSKTDADYGSIKMAEIMEVMPDVTKAKAELKAEAEYKRKSMTSKLTEYREKMSILQKSGSSLSEKARKNLEKKITELQGDLQNAQVEFETSLQKKQKKLFEPIEKDIEAVSKIVCKDKRLGRLEAIDNMQGKRYLFLDKKYDYTNFFKRKMGEYLKKKEALDMKKRGKN